MKMSSPRCSQTGQQTISGTPFAAGVFSQRAVQSHQFCDGCVCRFIRVF